LSLDRDNRAGDPLLSMQGIVKRFPGLLANDAVDLEVDGGEILALLGENGAGKTTLMNVLFGMLRADAGTIEFEGRPLDVRSPRDALDAGIGMVHQHFRLIENMTVAENVALGINPTSPARWRIGEISGRLEELADEHGLHVDPSALVEDLSVGERQRLEILKALYRGARVLILDEPSAVLTAQEWLALAAALRSLADQGKAIVLITHKLDEILQVATRCTVMRRGRVIGTVDVAAADKAKLARMMVGRDVDLRVPYVPSEPGDVVLEASGLRLTGPGGRELLHDVDITIRAGETVGIAGVEGNGQWPLVQVLVGLEQPTAGSIAIAGRQYEHLDPGTFTEAGGGLIPEDRHRTAVAEDLSLLDNLIMKEVSRPPLSHHGILDRGAGAGRAEGLVEEYDIRTPGTAVLMRQLSGGNQQKAVLARELSRDPILLIAAQPTRGLDVGAMQFVYATLAEHRKRGGATLLISAELDEVLSLSDRVAVMVKGAFVANLEREDVSRETVGMLMTGASA
jgi:simple sugar transport system ATP-binding protein